MAADAKKATIGIKKMISPFAEAKGKKAPPWVDALPGPPLAPLMIDRKMEVDPRKWKKKDLEDGVYAVARYQLAIMATKLGQIEKKVNGMLPPVKGQRNWAEVVKSKAPQDKKAIKTAQESLNKAWAQVSKEIENKVSVALDEVEADTGDNKKALSSAKEAFSKYDRVDEKKTLEQPIMELIDSLGKFKKTVGESNPDAKKKAVQEVEKTVSGVEGTFNANSKKMLEVVKYFHDSGKSMSKDEKANMVFQNLGKAIVGEIPKLKGLEKAIESLEDELTAVKNLIKKDNVNLGEISSLVSELQKTKSDAGKHVTEARKSVDKIRAQFKKAKSEVKA